MNLQQIELLGNLSKPRWLSMPPKIIPDGRQICWQSSFFYHFSTLERGVEKIYQQWLWQEQHQEPEDEGVWKHCLENILLPPIPGYRARQVIWGWRVIEVHFSGNFWGDLLYGAQIKHNKRNSWVLTIRDGQATLVIPHHAGVWGWDASNRMLLSIQKPFERPPLVWRWHKVLCPLQINILVINYFMWTTAGEA